MSYDFMLSAHCSCCDGTKYHFDKNYTSNTSPMFCKVFKEGIRILNDQNASEGGDTLFTFYKYFSNNKKELEKLNPSNGWGDYESTLQLIIDMHFASIMAPNDAVWNVYS